MTNPIISQHADLPAERLENSINHPRKQTLNSQSDIFTTDDLIGSLANAYENKRARQVFEWESTQRTKLRQAV